MNIFAIYAIILLVLGLVIRRRTKEMVNPIKGQGVKILLPILYMVPLGYVFSTLHVQLELWEMVVAAFIGIVLSIPLMLTTNYEIREDGQLYAQKNKSFFIALLAVLLIRVVLRQYFSGMEPMSVATLFYVVAIAYILPWRIVSFVKFRIAKESQNFRLT